MDDAPYLAVDQNEVGGSELLDGYREEVLPGRNVVQCRMPSEQGVVNFQACLHKTVCFFKECLIETRT